MALLAIGLVVVVTLGVVATPSDPFGPPPDENQSRPAAPRAAAQVTSPEPGPAPVPLQGGPWDPMPPVAGPTLPALDPPAGGTPGPDVSAARLVVAAPVPAASPTAAAARVSSNLPVGTTSPPAPQAFEPPAPTPPVAPTSADTVSASRTTFRVGTLNILGSQHRSGGTTRAAALAGAIVDRGVELVGMQEVQSDQLTTLVTGLSGYTLWPGRVLGNQGLRLQIAYRDSRFELVDAGWITTTFDHMQRPVPWVLLRERDTGGTFYFVDVHNSPGAQAADRYSATSEEIAMINNMSATGRAVLLGGDLNDHTTTACRISAATGMTGSNALSGVGGCRPGTGPIKIDHLLSSGALHLRARTVDYGAPVRTATDHAFVHAVAEFGPTREP